MYEGKKSLIIGLGISGRAAAGFLLNQGASVKGVDRNYPSIQSLPAIIELQKKGLELGDEASESVDSYDFIVVSPGIPQDHPLYRLARQKGIEMIGEIELGCRAIKENRIVGITGTNGKTTVTLLVTHVLNHCGKKARALGNVGMPLTEEIAEISKEEILVLELSSYQLETLDQPVLDAAVILNITPDHLDRYASMNDYANAKIRIGMCLKPEGSFYIESKTNQSYKSYLDKFKIRSYGYEAEHFLSSNGEGIFREGHSVFDLPNDYRGKQTHDIENVMAAYALCHEMGVSPENFLKGLQTFKKPAHRIEFVRTIEGVHYYDDSKGTNIDAVMRAVQFLSGPIVLIAGGVDKGSPYTPWLEVFKDKVKYICAIGQSAAKIEQQLASLVPVKLCSDLEQAINHAAGVAEKGDYVLLSPGCSSFDMFKDYVHRGKEFQRLVQQL